MRVPKATWSPPNPAAKSQFPQAGGPSSAAAPTSMKHRPITGTTRTENAPPVTKPVPYNSSQVPGSAYARPARYSTTVSRPPAAIGEMKLSQKRRPGPERIGSLPAYAFRTMAHPPMASATTASPNHVTSHSSRVGCRAARSAAANAAVEEVPAAGATKVLVNDSNWFMRNLLAEELHPGEELLSGDTKPSSMVQGIEDGFDAALFIGYHARAGTRNAILDHTYADRVAEVRLNGRAVGELGLNAALAGAHGVAVALVSGDAALAAEAKQLLGDAVTTVVVKQAVSRHAARSVAPAVACRMIREGVAGALKRKHTP